VVSVTPRPLFTPGKDPVPIVQEAGWAGKSRLQRDSIPGPPSPQPVAIPTELPRLYLVHGTGIKKCNWIILHYYCNVKTAHIRGINYELKFLYFVGDRREKTRNAPSLNIATALVLRSVWKREIVKNREIWTGVSLKFHFFWEATFCRCVIHPPPLPPMFKTTVRAKGKFILCQSQQPGSQLSHTYLSIWALRYCHSFDLPQCTAVYFGSLKKYTDRTNNFEK